MLTAVRTTILMDEGRCCHQFAGKRVVDFSNAQRRSKPAFAVERDTVECNEMRRAYDDERINGSIVELPIGMRRYGSRVHQSGVWCDQRDDIRDGRRPRRGLEIPVDLARELLGVR